MDVQAFLDKLRASREFQDQIVHCRVIPARAARYAKPRSAIDPRLRDALAAEGIDSFYTHQAAAIDAVAPAVVSGPCVPGAREHGPSKDIVVVSGTASGKTLCYNVPVINALLADPHARALYLFPTKALAQDQLGALQRLAAAHEDLARALRPSTFDGDTPSAKRRAARTDANVILTNPDMLHSGILPHHGRWASDRFLTNLEYVVIDELHAYRGTFGSHVAGVIRRLRRVCRHYGCDPTFICCSATIANPAQLASRLIGRPVTVIDDDGAPRGAKYFVLWNPPFVDQAQLERRSANIEAQRLMRELILEGAQTITFAKARVAAELIYKYLQEEFKQRHPELVDRIRPYRGGYLPAERREIEQQLFTGRLLGVCSTNALELGIDVGTLDAAIITGFPGTICSIKQQAGRAGRSQEESLAVFIAYNDPIDQYFMRHPDYFFAQSPEHAAINPLNPAILESQLRCAAGELALSNEDDQFFFNDEPDGGMSVVEYCKARVEEIPGKDNSWTGPANGPYNYHELDGRLPQHLVSLRLIGNMTFAIIDITDGRNESIANVDSISAPELVYPNAVYLHDACNYLVRDLDFDAKIARVQRTDVDYYTQPVLADHCRVVETQSPHEAHGLQSVGPGETGCIYFGRLDVTWQTIAFKKIKYYTLEVIGQEALDLPPQTIHTTGLWATFPRGMHRDLTAAGFKPIDAMVGIRNLMLVTLPMLAMCDRRDISGCVDSTNLGRLAMFVYDRYQGGLGYARLGYDHFAELLGVCHDLVTDCPCAEGCPSCVGLANLRPPLHADPDLGGGYAIPNKAATVLALQRWLT